MQCEKKTEMAEAFSLEDLILSVKDRSTAVSGNEAKRARRSGAASSSDSDHLKCHVGLHSDTHTHTHTHTHIYIYIYHIFVDIIYNYRPHRKG